MEYGALPSLSASWLSWWRHNTEGYSDSPDDKTHHTFCLYTGGGTTLKAIPIHPMTRPAEQNGELAIINPDRTWVLGPPKENPRVVLKDWRAAINTVVEYLRKDLSALLSSNA
jgi:hypothetical protein